MTNVRSSAWKRLLAVILSVAVVISMGAWSTAMVDAAAAPEVSVFLVGKDGQDKTLAQWNYDSENKTYTENGVALGIVKDFTSEENLAGEVNGKSYDFTDIGALPYTGINRKPDPRCLSVTTKGILLEDFYDYAEKKAGIDLRGDTMMYLSDSGGFNDTFTYDQYWGLDRYYYPDWYNAESYSAENMGNTERYVPTTLAVLGYHGTTGANLKTLISGADDANSLRISSGMQKNGSKAIAEIEGTTYSMGDINEGMLSVKGISVFRFTPVYNTISVADSTTSGTEGTDLIAKTKHATISTGDNYFKAAKGEPVELTATADEGYSVSGVTVKDEDDKEIDVTEDNGKWTFGMPAGAVTACIKVSEKKDNAGNEKKQPKKTTAKKAQPMNVKAKTKTFKAKKLKKKAKTFKAITVTNAKGKVTYAKISGSKKLNVNKKNGKLTIKKKTKKGLYKIKVRVNAAGDSQYKAGAKNVTVKVKVK